MNDDTRPDPDRLLVSVQRTEARARRGKLRIFFGAAAGVGKSYAMLEAARAARLGGTDVAIGYIELHGRPETERLLEGFEMLASLKVRHRGIERREFDLDGALARHPQVLLVDELAHSNPLDATPGPRHAKRWQDIDELLDAGINVWTTVNVQHLEGLNDLVAGITGVRQQETVPDRMFDEADQVELIDLPTEELQARLKAGKVYVPDQVGRALENFFRTPNLTALRELALRRTADRVDASISDLAGGEAARPWLARDRLLVALGPDEQAEQLVRAGKRMADGLDAVWTVVFVETPRLLRLTELQRNRRIAVLRLAESLGAETVTLDGPAPAQALLEYAQTRNVSRIVVGQPKRNGWRAWLRPSAVTQLIREAGTLDVIVVGARPDAAPAARQPVNVAQVPRLGRPVRPGRYAWGLFATCVCTLVCWPMLAHFELSNLAMVYLLGAALAGLRLGRGPAILTCVANVAAFDFFFVPPRFTFAISDLQYLVTFGVMLVVALALANLMVSVRLQNRIAGHRERRTAALYAMSRELARERSAQAMLELATRHISDVFGSRVSVLTAGADDSLVMSHAAATAGADVDLSVADWVFHSAAPAGLGTDTLAGAHALYLPLNGTQQVLGVVALLPANPRRLLLPEQRHLLDTFVGQVALALERAATSEEAERVRVAAETEGLRNSLLASISHDLRTPLAVIAGASDMLAEHPELDAGSRTELATSIHRHAQSMTEIVGNVLDLVRLESGALRLRIADCDVGELLGGVLRRLKEPLHAHPLHLQIPAGLPMVRADEILLGQLLGNLLENAARHTSAGTPIDVEVRIVEHELRICVADRGPGLPMGDPERLFDKFQRGSTEGPAGGVGLGLAICRAIARAHGGWIRARARSGGGAEFEVGLPLP